MTDVNLTCTAGLVFIFKIGSNFCRFQPPGDQSWKIPPLFKSFLITIKLLNPLSPKRYKNLMLSL